MEKCSEVGQPDRNKGGGGRVCLLSLRWAVEMNAAHGPLSDVTSKTGGHDGAEGWMVVGVRFGGQWANGPTCAIDNG